MHNLRFKLANYISRKTIIYASAILISFIFRPEPVFSRFERFNFLHYIFLNLTYELISNAYNLFNNEEKSAISFYPRSRLMLPITINMCLAQKFFILSKWVIKIDNNRKVIDFA